MKSKCQQFADKLCNFMCRCGIFCQSFDYDYIVNDIFLCYNFVMKKFIAEKDGSVLLNLRGHLSKTILGKIKQNGKVVVGGKSVRMSHMITQGEEIFVELPKKDKEEVVPYFCHVGIAYEDEDIIVLQKPSGMPTHTSRGNFETTLENAYCGLLVSRGEDVADFTFHPITRLDSETSGLVLIGKNAISTAKLSKDMQGGKIAKEYMALASGVIENDFCVEIYMGRVEEGKPYRWQKDGGKHSLSYFEIVDKINGDTLVKVTPKTGRTHQIRVHLAFSGHAIVGDKLYQNGGLLCGEKPCGRLMLFMHELEFYNMAGEKICEKSSE